MTTKIEAAIHELMIRIVVVEVGVATLRIEMVPL